MNSLGRDSLGTRSLMGVGAVFGICISSFSPGS